MGTQSPTDSEGITLPFATLNDGAKPLIEKIGIKKFALDSQFHVVGFYEKCGYEKVSDVFLEAGIKHIKMEKYI